MRNVALERRLIREIGAVQKPEARNRKPAKMAGQTAKKELLEETLHHHPEGSEEEVDKEWEEFTRLMAKLKESRRNRPHRYIRDRIFCFR